MNNKILNLAGLALAAALLHGAGNVQAGGISIDRVPLEGVIEPIREAIQEAQLNLEQARAGGNATLRAQAYAAYGDVLLAHGFNEQAAQAYRNAQQLAPSMIDWPYLLGVIAAGDGRLDQALTLFNQALRLDPYDRPTLARRGQLHLDRDELEAAEADFRSLIQLDPDMAVAQAGLGRVALLREEHEQAAELLQAALRANPQATRLYRPLAMAYRGLGRVEDARRALEFAGDGDLPMRDPSMDRVTAQSRSPQFFLEAALARADAGDLHGARELLINAVALDPEDRRILEAYGEVAARQGDHGEARATFRRLILLDPDVPDAYVLLGQLDEMRGEPGEAIAAYEQALSISPGLAVAYEGLAFAHLAAGNLDEADRRFAELADVNQGTDADRFAYWQGKVWLAGGDCDRALGRFDQLRSDRESVDPLVLSSVARIRSTCRVADQAGLNEALDWAETIYDISPDTENAATLAMVHAARGEFDDAVDFQAQAMFQALRDGELDLRSDLRESMSRYQQGQRAAQPYGRGYPPFGVVRSSEN